MITKHSLKYITGEWYLWHSIKNENAIIPVIVLSFLFIFCKVGGLIVSIGIWIWYFCYCNKNNDALNNDPQILLERAWWIQRHKEKGELEEFKRIIGI